MFKPRLNDPESKIHQPQAKRETTIQQELETNLSLAERPKKHTRSRQHIIEHEFMRKKSLH